MDGIKNIDISNFRGIDHLKIDDFSKVNVFLGQNNSGKTTMLEEQFDYRDEMALYTLEQAKLKGHQAYRLPYEGLAETCKNNVEIRSISL